MYLKVGLETTQNEQKVGDKSFCKICTCEMYRNKAGLLGWDVNALCWVWMQCKCNVLEAREEAQGCRIWSGQSGYGLTTFHTLKVSFLAIVGSLQRIIL